MKFWQVIAAILIWRLWDVFYERTFGFGNDTTTLVVSLLIYVLLAALVWIASFYVFRAIDARNDR